MFFVVDVKSLLLHRVNSYSTQLICIPNEIFIEKKFSFIVRLLYFVGIRSVLKLKYELYVLFFFWRAPCTLSLFCLMTEKSVNV